MRLPDVNLFLYAYDDRSPRHGAARDWLEQTLSGTETVGLPWMVLLAFIRLSTRPVVVERPFDVEGAIELVERWLAQPCVTVINPTERHAAVLRDLLLPLGTAGNLTSDAHLAALAIEHGATLCSCDNDFSRFSGLRWVDPLTA
ncbi:MAG TPA: type II toxin-antitoxin system VapC family toxin [Solirubrobacteraceae bacterium]|nr:type II toxin-antitoxin system VapC family toxin [Solirubrobacteraceae bacterium]